MSEDESFELQVGAELYVSPLKALASEAHEIYTELLDAGFPDKAVNQIMANMLGDVIFYQTGPMLDGFDDDEDEEEDDTDDEREPE